MRKKKKNFVKKKNSEKFDFIDYKINRNQSVLKS